MKVSLTAVYLEYVYSICPRSYINDVTYLGEPRNQSIYLINLLKKGIILGNVPQPKSKLLELDIFRTISPFLGVQINATITQVPSPTSISVIFLLIYLRGWTIWVKIITEWFIVGREFALDAPDEPQNLYNILRHITNFFVLIWKCDTFRNVLLRPRRFGTGILKPEIDINLRFGWYFCLAREEDSNKNNSIA